MTDTLAAPAAKLQFRRFRGEYIADIPGQVTYFIRRAGTGWELSELVALSAPAVPGVTDNPARPCDSKTHAVLVANAWHAYRTRMQETARA